MKTSKILVADHDTKSLTHLGQVLESAQYTAKLVSTGHQAIDAITSFKPDICVIDPMISGIDGFTVSQRISHNFPKIKVIISTAFYKGDRYRRDARTRYGAAAYLEKPYTDERLLEIVANLLSPSTNAPHLIALDASDITDPSLSEISASHAKITDTLPGKVGLEIDQTINISEHDMEQNFERLREDRILNDGPKGLFEELDFNEFEKENPVSLDEEVTVSAPIPEDPMPLNEPEPEFGVEDTLVAPAPGKDPNQDFRLTADDIFGSVIDDIESGRSQKKQVLQGYDEQTNPNQVPSINEPPTNPDLPKAVEDGLSQPRYELLEQIHEDRAFEIWKALNQGAKGFQQTVTIKRIKAEYIDNVELNRLFLVEAKAAAALSHQNIVQVHEVGELNGARFIARDYIPGYSLEHTLKIASDRDTTLPPHMVAYIGSKLCDALSYAHARTDLEGRPLNIVHHSITPATIIISDDGEVKLIDFGVGNALTHTPDSIPMEQLPYISPEQSGLGVPDIRSDQFALASVLYRAVTGVDPFTGTDRSKLLTKILEAAAPSVDMVLPSIPQQFAAILAKAMNKDPDLRYPDCSNFASDLRNFLKRFHVRLEEQDLKNYVATLSRKAIVDRPPPELPELNVPAMSSPAKETLPNIITIQKEAPSVDLPVKPVSIVVADPQAAPPKRRPPSAMAVPPKKKPLGLIALAAVLLIVVLGVLWWQGIIGSGKTVIPVEQPVTSQTLPQDKKTLPNNLATESPTEQPPGTESSIPSETLSENTPPLSESQLEDTSPNVTEPASKPDGVKEPDTPKVDDDEAALILKQKQDKLLRMKEELERLQENEPPPNP